MNTSAPGSLAEGDAIARRNAIVLALSMALAGANASVVIATGSILGSMLAPNKSLATLPISTFVFGTFLFAYPASHLMKLVGRRAGFMIGCLAGVLAGLTGAAAVWVSSFWLYTLSTTLCGAYQSFVVLYRYAAADTATPQFRPKAISWVMVGGALASFVGPPLVILTKDLAPPMLFFATYLGQAAFAAAAILVVSRFEDGPPISQAASGAVRSLGAILKQGRLVAAIITGMVSQAMMNMVMTATPIAMVGCGFSVTDSTLGIQWHVLAMYLPSFFTGTIISRFGKGPVAIAGLVMLALSGAINIAGQALWNFWGSLILLGIGWNFAFVAATAMVTDCHTPAERAKVQGFTDVIIFGGTTIASFMAGYLYETLGWSAVNWVLIPVTALAMAALLLASLSRPAPRA
jgi:MFS family permease